MGTHFLTLTVRPECSIVLLLRFVTSKPKILNRRDVLPWHLYSHIKANKISLVICNCLTLTHLFESANKMAAPRMPQGFPGMQMPAGGPRPQFVRPHPMSAGLGQNLDALQQKFGVDPKRWRYSTFMLRIHCDHLS